MLPRANINANFLNLAFMLLTIKRTFKEAIINFFRNGWLSIATVSILILSLYVGGVLYVVTFTVDNILKNVQEKVNISMYFSSDVSEDKINEIKSTIMKYGEVKSADYISKEQALEDFKKNNANEPIIMQSLQEIGDNPLQSSLVIKANNANQYPVIVNALEKADFNTDISRINYGKNKEIIDKLNSIIATIRRIGIVLGVIFAAIAILITFNTIRITIYTHRQEIEIMRLVGASNTFIRLPFIFEGIIYGLAASIISMIILFITLKFITPYVSSVIPSENLISFYFSNFFNIFGIQILIGIFLGVFSSWIAMRKYLKI